MSKKNQIIKPKTQIHHPAPFETKKKEDTKKVRKGSGSLVEEEYYEEKVHIDFNPAIFRKKPSKTEISIKKSTPTAQNNLVQDLINLKKLKNQMEVKSSKNPSKLKQKITVKKERNSSSSSSSVFHL